MSFHVHDWPPKIYGNGMNMLSEKLRRNWMQKLDSSNLPDDSLTSLNWLYDMHPIGIEMETNVKFCEMDMASESSGSACLVKFSSYGPHRFAGSLFDPKVRLEYRTKWTGKPPFSYASLICLAMRELGKPKVTLSDIYGWIMNNFAYYRHTDSSWQNSVRHNLSLNKCFEKVPRDKNERGKGGFWRVNPKHADWLEANLAKCRKAAPPPGPPPPMPRSMLLQQRQQQQIQEPGLLVSSSQLPTSFGIMQGVSPDVVNPMPHSRFESPKWSTNTALSPSSASSISSLSSSPQSMSSVPSPAGILSNRLHTPLGPYSHLLPISSGYVSNVCTPLENDSSVSIRTTLPSIQQGPQLGQSSVCHAPVRRRKSPLNTCTSRDSTCSSMIGVDDDEISTADIEYRTVDCPRRKGTPEHHKSSPDTKSHRRPGHGIESLSHRSHTNRMPKSQHELLAAKLDRSVRSNGTVGASGNAMNSLTPRGGRSEHKFKHQLAKEQLKLTSKKQIGTARARCDSKLVPTRVLPPRHRYSRWSRPRSDQDNWSDLSSARPARQCSPSKRRSSSESEESSNEVCNKLKVNRYPYLPCLDEDGEDSDNTWPPCGHSSSCKRPDSPDTTCSCHTYADEQHRVTLPRLSEVVQPSSLTPPYVPAGLAPGRPGYSGSLPRESSSSAASSCSLGSAFSNLSSSNGSDGHAYHNNQIGSQRNSSRVETQPNTIAQFSRLYPTSGEAEFYLGASSDRLRMPKWAAVFLPEGEESELEPLYNTVPQPTDRETMNFFNSLDATDDELLSLSNHDEHLSRLNSSDDLSLDAVGPNEHRRNLDCMEHSTASTATNSATIAVQSGGLVTTDDDVVPKPTDMEPRSQTHFLASSSPLLEEFELDSGGLDFDALSSLVEASGPIPLDLDLALTASFSGNYTTYSNDSALGCSEQDRTDLNHSIKNSGASPWPGGSTNSTSGLDHSWFVDSMSYSDSCCLVLGEGDSQPPQQAEISRLNTPPS